MPCLRAAHPVLVRLAVLRLFPAKRYLSCWGSMPEPGLRQEKRWASRLRSSRLRRLTRPFRTMRPLRLPCN